MNGRDAVNQPSDELLLLSAMASASTGSFMEGKTETMAAERGGRRG
jgi:hypothetical protein